MFGTIVEHEGSACYKIDREGKVTTFLTIIDFRTKKQVTYESKLLLKKLRDMTETEILAEKSTKEKKTIFYELMK